ncbi:hypothetical protein EI77_02185 [Prosthecobacter fusiformis]|uniref:Uncharacterized protein n=1 Tax=Prosthecobacter fusiformis TaxID=48464 RepID=A0A4R7S243_9BACT|nr:hypothetical protein [Prosthecobacter fusiformis]TDU71067.1 hypothetical protein EI77_02185 [Prosthecobacter fusiformis]
MKRTFLTTLILAATTSLLLAHGGVELGPNGGRILEFSKDETMHGEVTVKDGKFNIALLDKDMKPVSLDKQEITVSTGDRDKPTRLTVEKDKKGFSLPVVAEGQWLIVQYRSSPDAKPITARMNYDTGICSGCNKAEWLCQCKD